MISDSGFGIDLDEGSLNALYFEAASVVTDNNDGSDPFFFYDTDTGELFFDSDPNIADDPNTTDDDPILIATFTGIPNLSEDDIFIIA